MRNLTRPKLEPPTLKQAAQKNYEVSSGHWRNPDVRGMLRAMLGQSCAYCQSSMEGRMRPGTVDHFRPTSKYLWLAYRIENLILACHDCNSRVKNSDFPIDQGGARAESDDDLPSELRLLLDPVADPIDQRLGIDYLDKRFSFQNLVTNRYSIEYRRVSETIKVLRFDRGADPTYRKIRAQVLGKYTEKIERHERGSLSLAEQSELRREVCRWKPFGEMAQGLIRFHLSESEANKLCPSPEQECLWLIDDLATVFEEAPTTDDAEKQQGEVRWCFAALLKSPPKGVSKVVIKKRLTELGMLSDIEELAKQFGKQNAKAAKPI
ncbi:MAG: HNH endonuclease [Planctomycetota bacterium]|nr:HNH endonuclease [Planctomycetota bacterium]MDA0919691.1 HNH endonuclease [Planctomycetota bacterium]MDA1158838.1 HNH endonuclease [Planctomycetota bacterium]